MTYSQYILSPDWTTLKLRFKSSNLYKGKCEVCACRGVLDVHHRTYKRLFNEKLMDLMALCPICHHAAHRRQERSPRGGLWGATRPMRKQWTAYASKHQLWKLRSINPTSYRLRVAQFFHVNIAERFVARAFINREYALHRK